MAIYRLDRMMAGLNNQKMAISGLFAIAAERSGEARVPDHAFDFTPMEGRSPIDSESIPIWTVFDKEQFSSGRHADILSEESGSEVISFNECFAAGGKALTRAGRVDFRPEDDFPGTIALSVIEHLVAAPDLSAIAQRTLGYLPLEKSSALQLRIERDWQEHLRRKFGATELIRNGEHITVNPDTIFAKIRNTPDFKQIDTIWACCDEDDLLINKERVREIASTYSFYIVFKSDMKEQFTWPKSRLQSSIIDFEIASEMFMYVGLSLSTFSNILYITRSAKKKRNITSHFRYNVAGDVCKRRG